MTYDSNHKQGNSNKMPKNYVGTSQESDFLKSVDEVAQNGSEDKSQDLPMGQKIKILRQEKQLTLKDISLRTGLEETYLEKIEQGKTNPPLGILVKLGKALDMKMGAFISGKKNLPYSVVRVDERKDLSRYPHERQTSYGYSYQSLAPDKADRSMEPVMVTLTSKGLEVEPSSHDGQEFVYVIKGDMEVQIGDNLEILKPGDCIYYESKQPHVLRPHGKGPTTILAVLCSQPA